MGGASGAVGEPRGRCDFHITQKQRLWLRNGTTESSLLQPRLGECGQSKAVSPCTLATEFRALLSIECHLAVGTSTMYDARFEATQPLRKSPSICRL